MKLELKHLRHNAKYKLWIFGEKKMVFMDGGVSQKEETSDSETFSNLFM